MTERLFRPTFMLCLLMLAAALGARAQTGSGDLPPPPKSKAKTATPTRTRPTPKPTPKVPTFREPASFEPIKFNQSADGGIDGQASGRIPPGTFFNEYVLKLTTADLFAIQLQSANPALTIQLTDNNRMDVPLARDERTGVYKVKAAEGTVAADGDYRVRVLVNASGPPPQPILYSLTVKRTGLTEAGYRARLEQIVADFNGRRDPASSLRSLEALAADDPNRPEAYEYLGVLYLEHSNDLVKATTAMTGAIQRGGAATFRVLHDSRWRRPEGRPPNLAWTDQRTDWLKIYKDKLVIADFTDQQKKLLEFTGAQIQNFFHPPAGPVVAVKHTLRQIKPDTISFGLRNPPEAELVFDLINDFVAQKKQRAPRFLK